MGRVQGKLTVDTIRARYRLRPLDRMAVDGLAGMDDIAKDLITALKAERARALSAGFDPEESALALCLSHFLAPNRCPLWRKMR